MNTHSSWRDFLFLFLSFLDGDALSDLKISNHLVNGHVKRNLVKLVTRGYAITQHVFMIDKMWDTFQCIIVHEVSTYDFAHAGMGVHVSQCPRMKNFTVLRYLDYGTADLRLQFWASYFYTEYSR